MKQLMMAALTTCAVLFSATLLNAQLTSGETKKKGSIVNGYSAEFYGGSRIEMATPVNVVKWATELNTELVKLSSKLSKIKTTNVKEAKTKKLIEDARILCVQIIRKGNSLSATDAKKHDKWFWNGMFSLVGECLETNPGSECCFSCTGGGAGYSDFWCKANCFVWRFPSLD
jgi:predicted DNA-binding protein